MFPSSGAGGAGPVGRRETACPLDSRGAGDEEVPQASPFLTNRIGRPCNKAARRITSLRPGRRRPSTKGGLWPGAADPNCWPQWGPGAGRRPDQLLQFSVGQLSGPATQVGGWGSGRRDDSNPPPFRPKLDQLRWSRAPWDQKVRKNETARGRTNPRTAPAARGPVRRPPQVGLPSRAQLWGGGPLAGHSSGFVAQRALSELPMRDRGPGPTESCCGPGPWAGRAPRLLAGGAGQVRVGHGFRDPPGRPDAGRPTPRPGPGNGRRCKPPSRRLARPDKDRRPTCKPHRRRPAGPRFDKPRADGPDRPPGWPTIRGPRRAGLDRRAPWDIGKAKTLVQASRDPITGWKSFGFGTWTFWAPARVRPRRNIFSANPRSQVELSNPVVRTKAPINRAWQKIGKVDQHRPSRTMTHYL